MWREAKAVAISALWAATRAFRFAAALLRCLYAFRALNDAMVMGCSIVWEGDRDAV
jgi:hypothetical protein